LNNHFVMDRITKTYIRSKIITKIVKKIVFQKFVTLDQIKIPIVSKCFYTDVIRTKNVEFFIYSESVKRIKIMKSRKKHF
jgi:hypothetical protein